MTNLYLNFALFFIGQLTMLSIIEKCVCDKVSRIEVSGLILLRDWNRRIKIHISVNTLFLAVIPMVPFIIIPVTYNLVAASLSGNLAACFVWLQFRLARQLILNSYQVYAKRILETELATATYAEK